MHQKDQRPRANLRRLITRYQKEIGYIYIKEKRSKKYHVQQKMQKELYKRSKEGTIKRGKK